MSTRDSVIAPSCRYLEIDTMKPRHGSRVESEACNGMNSRPEVNAYMSCHRTKDQVYERYSGMTCLTSGSTGKERTENGKPVATNLFDSKKH